MEVAPRARRCRVRGQSTFDRIRQPQTDGLTRLSIYFIRSCWGKQYFQIATLKQANFIAIIYTLHRWTQFIISKKSSQLFKTLEISSRKVPNRERSEEKLMPSVLTGPFSKFEFSHLFLRCWPALASPTPGEQNRWRLLSIWTAITSQNYRCIQANELYSIVARSESIYKLPEWASNPQIYLRAIPTIIYLFYSKYSRRNTSCRSRQHQAIQLWLHLQQFNSPLTLSAEPLIG